MSESEGCFPLRLVEAFDGFGDVFDEAFHITFFLIVCGIILSTLAEAGFSRLSLSFDALELRVQLFNFLNVFLERSHQLFLNIFLF